MAKIRIMFSRYSAFYSPLVATQAAGFLAAEGLEAEFSVARPDFLPAAALAAGAIELSQSAVSAGWGPLERGESSDIVHFAQINQRDGFFIAGRTPDPDFTWQKLRGAKVLADHGGQPLAMFQYGLHRQGVAYDTLEALDAGDPDAMVAAFKEGQGDYIHLQGPAPQQLEAEGVGHVLARVGEAIGLVAFSSLCSHRAWLGSDMAGAFTRAFEKARDWARATAPAEVARIEAPFFEGIDRAALTRTIAAYQALGCWRGGIEIPRDAYEVALDVFQHADRISRRHAYDQIVVPPPG